MGLGGHVARVEVQAGDGVGALGLGGLLLDGDGPPLAVELHDAEALGVVHVVAEDRGAARLRVLDGLLQVARKAVAVEDVVAEHERARLAGDEVLADGEGLGQAVGARLLGVGEVHAVARAVPEQALEVGQVGRRGDDQDVPDARQHEGGQRVVDHGLVVDRQQLLAGDERERVQARARATREDDAFHRLDLQSWAYTDISICEAEPRLQSCTKEGRREPSMQPLWFTSLRTTRLQPLDHIWSTALFS